MSEKKSKLNKKDKKILTIVGSAGLATAIALGGTGVYFTMSDPGREQAQAISDDFKPVSLPENSRDLTEVPEAPVGKLDSSDSDFLNVDMQGRKIEENTDDSQSAVIETPVNSNNKLETKNRNNKITNNTATPHRNPTAEDMKQVSNIGKRFVVPSVGLDVTLGAMNETNGIIRPTNFTNAFIVRNRGTGEDLTKAKNGTLYIAMHATDAGSIAPGNFLVDNTTRANRLKEGEMIEVGNLKYKITQYKREGKDVIAQDKEIWNGKIKNRIVVFTCFPNSADNAVFIGELISS